MAGARNQQIWLRLDQPHNTRMHPEIVDNHGEPLLMSNQELYSVMVQINWTLESEALANMQVQWRPKSTVATKKKTKLCVSVCPLACLV